MVRKTASKRSASRTRSAHSRASRGSGKQREYRRPHFGFNDPLVGFIVLVLSFAILITLLAPLA